MGRHAFVARLASFRFVALALGLALLAALLVAVPLPVHAVTSAATGTGGLYVPATQRIAQSSNGTGGLPTSRMVSNHWYQIPIEGAGSLPADGISAVQVTFTIQNQTSSGSVHADSGSDTSPNTSTPYVTYDATNNIANAAVLPVGTNGNIQVQVTSQADMVINVQGYYTDGAPAAGGFVAMGATQVFNSGSTEYTTGQSTTFQVAGNAGVPTDASAVVLSVIEGNTGTDAGYLYAYPQGTARSTALDWPAGKNYEWTTVVTLPASGKVSLFIGSSASGVKLSAHVQGYYTANNGPAVSGAFTPGTARVYNSQSPSAPIPANTTRTVKVAGVNGVPAAGSGITAAAINLSVISGSGAQGHAPIFPSNGSAGSDAVQFYASSTTLAFATVKLGADGAVKIENDSDGTINVIVDVEGWFSTLDTGPTTTGLTGSRPSATNLPFKVSDRVSAQVDVATGNLQVSTSGLTLPAIGSQVSIGQTYNSLGWQTGHTFDPSATVWALGLDAAGSLSQAVDGVVYTGADGSTWLFKSTLDATGKPVFTTPAGIQATLTLETSAYKLKSYTSAQVIKFNLNGRPTDITDRNSNNVAISYTNDIPTKIVSNAGVAGARTANLGYVASSGTFTASQTSGSLTRSVKWVKDSASNLTSFVDANGATTTFAYSGHDLTSITGPTGAVTTFTYNSGHKVVRVDQQNTTAGSPGTSTTRLSYVSGTDTQVAGPDTDPAAAVADVARTDYTIDSNHLVTKAVDPVNRSRGRTYNGPSLGVASDTTGDASASTGSTTTSAQYNANSGQSVSQVQSPGQGAKSTAEYGSGVTQYSQMNSTDDAGNKSSSGYDGLGNTMSSTDPDGVQASIVRNANDQGDGSNDGQVHAATAPKNKGTGGNPNNSTIYNYDDNHQLDTITPVSGTNLGANHFTYDAYGRVASESDGNANTTSYTYDDDDRLLTTSYSDGTATVTSTFDAAGRLLTQVSASGTVTDTYDQLGRILTTGNTAGGGTETYTYDKESNQLTSSDSFGTYTNKYDASGVLLQTAYPKAGGTQYLTYTTDDHGRRTDEFLQSNQNTGTDSGFKATTWAAHYQTTYDKTTGRVSEIKSWRDSGDPTLTFDTIYCHSDSTGTNNTDASHCGTDPLLDRSKLQSSFDVLGQQKTVYSYDHGGRITKVAQSDGNAGNTTWTYGYDSDGNRTSASATGEVTSSQNLTFNAADQIVNTGYSYDDNGNLATARNVTFTYNAAQQMTTATRNGLTTTYTYAGASQDAVLSATTPGGTTYKTSYGAGGIATYQARDDTSHVFTDPITGQATMLTTSTDVDALYIDDGIGNITGLVTDGSDNAFRQSFDPFGAPSLDDPGTGDGAAQNPYTFKNGITDRATGLVKFGQRWYDATTGTWTQRDTLDTPLDPKNANRYGFAAGDPINGSDPTGAYFSVGLQVCAIVCGNFGYVRNHGHNGITGGFGAGLDAGASIDIGGGNGDDDADAVTFTQATAGAAYYLGYSHSFSREGDGPITHSNYGEIGLGIGISVSKEATQYLD